MKNLIPISLKDVILSLEIGESGKVISNHTPKTIRVTCSGLNKEGYEFKCFKSDGSIIVTRVK